MISIPFSHSSSLSDLFRSVPTKAMVPPAIAVVLIQIGVMMMGESLKKKMEWELMKDAIPAFLTMVLIPLRWYLITNWQMCA